MNYNKNERLSFYSERKLSSGKIWMLFILFGWSYGSMGKGWKQLFYYCTLGGLGLWTAYVIFTLNGKIRKYNKAIANKVGLNSDDLIMLGL